jgi:hypothetical protein
MDEERDSFALRLRKLLDGGRITQEVLAKRIDVGQPAISVISTWCFAISLS